MSSYVSTNSTDEYFYELSFESSSSARAVLAPKEDSAYSLIVYEVNTGKVKGVSEGKIKKNGSGLTLKPNDTNDTDITVTISDGEMTAINGKTNKGGNHTMPGKVKPFKQTEGVYGDYRYVTNPGSTVTIIRYTGNGGAVNIPDNINGKPVIGIGYSAFARFYSASALNITSITIPDTVTSIAQQAFFDCAYVTSVTIGNNVNTIGMHAFSRVGFETTSTCTLTLPKSVTSIGEFAFDNTLFNAINVDAANTVYSSQDGVLYNKNKTTLLWCPLRKTGSVTIPNSVTVIEYGAFRLCESLTSVIIPNSVITIGDDAFEQCSSLTSINIPNSVTSIGGYAFYGCSSFTSITIGSGVANFSDYFSQLGNLTEINVDANNPAYSSQDGVLYNKAKTTLIKYPAKKSGTSFTIPDSVTSIGDYVVGSAFHACDNLTSITIPNSVTSIGKYAFSRCSSLTSVTIGNGVTSIGEYAFSYCVFTSITIPNSVTSIAADAFASCSSLASVTIGNGVTSIGKYVFYGCKSLTSVTFETGSNISSANFGDDAFPEGPNVNTGNTLKNAYLKASPKAGTYTRAPNGWTWTKS